MAHAEKCPICNGVGIVYDREKWDYFKKMTGAFSTREGCYGCGGKGWVEVQDENNWERKFLDCEQSRGAIKDKELKEEK